MASEAAVCAERATSDMLIGPDWSVNIELCDIINAHPGHATDALRVLKKQLGSRNPQVQLLTLDVLDTLSKNCGNKIFQQIADADILQDLINIIKNKPDLHVREKILSLIDTWQEALGGRMGRFPQYYYAYQELLNAGVRFPPREGTNVPLFTPPENRPVAISVYDEAPVQTSFQTDTSTSTLSVTEFKSVCDLTDILKEMIGALDPRNSEGANEEVILDLVEQCRSYQKRVMLLLNSTSDEDLLFQGLALNDSLLNVLHQHENMVKGIAPACTQTTATPRVNKIHTNHDVEDDADQLAQRSKARKASRKTGSTPVSPFLPPPPSSKNPIMKDAKDTNVVDFLSGDFFTLEAPGSSSKETQNELPTTSSNQDFTSTFSSTTSLASPSNTQDPFATQEFHGKSFLEEPSSTVKQSLSPPSSSQNISPNQFFDQQASHSHDESAYSLPNTLEPPMRSLSLDTPTPKKQEKTDDDLFKELLDFARAKPSSPSSSRLNKRLS